ncbi:hypothetical protein MHYP_G00358430 [Metynnis hypsauchen]
MAEASGSMRLRPYHTLGSNLPHDQFLLRACWCSNLPPDSDWLRRERARNGPFAVAEVAAGPGTGWPSVPNCAPFLPLPPRLTISNRLREGPSDPDWDGEEEGVRRLEGARGGQIISFSKKTTTGGWGATPQQKAREQGKREEEGGRRVNSPEFSPHGVRR